jgi:hypothetical protein
MPPLDAVLVVALFAAFVNGALGYGEAFRGGLGLSPEALRRHGGDHADRSLAAPCLLHQAKGSGVALSATWTIGGDSC